MTAVEHLPQLLADVVGALEARGAHTWSFTLGRDGRTGWARRDGDWLVLAGAPPRPLAAGHAWSTLEHATTLSGGVRFALAAATPGLELRADVPLDAEVDVARRISDAYQGLTTAAGVAPAARDDAQDLARRCREAGFAAEPCGAHRLAVHLGVPDATERALATTSVDGLVTISVALVDAATTSLVSEVARRAVARLLLRLAGVVRFVRPAVTPGDPASLRFETVMTVPTTVELAHAFTSLAVACRLGAGEVTALLHDEALARLYLQQHQHAAAPRAA